MGSVAQCRLYPMKEFLMADTDLSQQFEKVSDRAKAAADKVKAANAHARDQLQADAAAAREKATEANDEMKAKAGAQHAKASSHWQDVRAKWQEHVAKVRQDAKNRKEKLDAKEAARDSDWAEAYAADAIAFAGAVIEEAAAAALDAMYLRAYAKVSQAKVGS
jgi:hypothetical protein